MYSLSDANLICFQLQLHLEPNLSSIFRGQGVGRSELMILALISIACFSDISNSLQAMLICARISNAIGTDAFLHDVHLGYLLYCSHSRDFSSYSFAFESVL